MPRRLLILVLSTLTVAPSGVCTCRAGVTSVAETCDCPDAVCADHEHQCGHADRCGPVLNETDGTSKAPDGPTRDHHSPGCPALRKADSQRAGRPFNLDDTSRTVSGSGPPAGRRASHDPARFHLRHEAWKAEEPPLYLTLRTLLI